MLDVFVYQFQMNKKQSVICEFEMDFKKSFCCAFNLSNDDITSVLCKHVMLRFVTTSRSEKGSGKLNFWAETEGQYLENRGTHPHQEFPGVSPWYPGYQRFLSLAAGICDTSSVVGRAGHYKDLTETGNRAREVSGTQGTPPGEKPRNLCLLLPPPKATSQFF